MPEYYAPGVYVEEIELGAKPIEGVSTSIAGFLGQTERGPIVPILITGFEEFKRLFGEYIDNSYLAYGVEGFFRNGGKQCYVSRITRGDAKPAEDSIQVGTNNSIRVSATGPGTWGGRMFFKIEDPTQKDIPKNTRFKLTIMYFKSMPPDPIVDPTDPKKRTDPNRREPELLEIYDNISVNPKSSSFYKNLTQGSNLCVFFDDIPKATTAEPLAPPSNAPLKALQSGSDGTGEINKDDYEGREDPLMDPFTNTLIGVQRTGLKGLAAIDDISIVCAPDEPTVDDLRDSLIDHCEVLKYRFVILQTSDADANPGGISNLQPARESKYAALYFPWINVFDPLTGNLKLIPPGPHVAGIYARSDTNDGVHASPANEVVRGASSLQMVVTKEQQEVLNPRGVNVIRAFAGRGILVWGARTISRDTLWKYINVRRLFIFIERSIDEGSQWLVFEPNNERLWSRVVATITQFLTRVWRDGMLMGKTPEEAFFVKCDRTTMTEDDIANGRLKVLVGVCPVRPAEFVIVRITQSKAGADIEELGG